MKELSAIYFVINIYTVILKY